MMFVDGDAKAQWLRFVLDPLEGVPAWVGKARARRRLISLDDRFAALPDSSCPRWLLLRSDSELRNFCFWLGALRLHPGLTSLSPEQEQALLSVDGIDEKILHSSVRRGRLLAGPWALAASPKSPEDWSNSLLSAGSEVFSAFLVNFGPSCLRVLAKKIDLDLKPVKADPETESSAAAFLRRAWREKASL